jgi:hypothetical protein
MIALEWKLGSRLFMKGGTKLVCSGLGGGKLFVLGAKHGTRKQIIQGLRFWRYPEDVHRIFVLMY